VDLDFHVLKLRNLIVFLLQCKTPVDTNLLERKIMKFIILNVQINNNSSFTSTKQGLRPTTQGKNPLGTEVIIACTPLMNYRKLSRKWNSKYVHFTVPHYAISTGYECLLGYNVPIITNILEIKIIINYVLNVQEFC
jgi:hypothetical protein